jgi:hypothetical protein
MDGANLARENLLRFLDGGVPAPMKFFGASGLCASKAA